MRTRIIIGLAALATACASAPAFAAPKHVIVDYAPTYSNTGPWSAPLSPNGAGAGASAFGGPGFNGPSGAQQPNVKPMQFSTMGPKGAPLSPNGAGAGASAFGGPGFNGPYADQTNVKPMQFSTMGPKGAPLSPNGAGAGASAFGGPGYQM